MSELRAVSFIAKTGFAWQVWKETLPDLHWFLEKNFQASKVNIKLTGEEKNFVVELECPNDSVPRLEKSFKDGTLGTEIDKIHGMDPAFSCGKKDAKLSRFCTTMAEARPQNAADHTIEALEQQIVQLELLERARSIDLKMVMENLLSFQTEFQKKFEALDKKVGEMSNRLDQKAERLSATLQRFKK
ncbi:hypothetical protein BCR33DRAFT_712754 [Rhizoclosmatium globosum]|uniref:Uncharacterized protein n=1 Tax=Rhizoclosmatium globosum TaxID=329046 RepID=A0A1Y2CV58_9FUNG|nr:hypothetical protein HDU99_006578 [Rhizoclosmatium hyalinum]ORY50766.1 hypothetical protein BCR33DRAFT_712754 [Rhizoclosmatium globosum]|eukprot:ORY50766.1 hypothetical protein BCR33DRAFT_712754 [Rhizoclosmatium globosum]